MTMFFLRRAHELFSNQPEKSLSPSFWDSEGQASSELVCFDAVLSGIEHPLGSRLPSGPVHANHRFFQRETIVHHRRHQGRCQALSRVVTLVVRVFLTTGQNLSHEQRRSQHRQSLSGRFQGSILGASLIEKQSGCLIPV